MSTDRFRRHYPGLSTEECRTIIEEHLRPWLTLLTDWQRRLRPSDTGPYFPIDRTKQALNELARSLTGEPLWKPQQVHKTPTSGASNPGEET